MIAAPPVPPAVEILTIQPIGNRWRVTSSDGLFEGVFTDAKSAVRCAKAEAEAHPGHILLLAEPRMAA
ncbi:hypothetical protein EGY25_15280 [Brevundimonas intermedia]|uniref:DUF2188 domain-containing protein n=1 Tax=Brevundimonas intermedia TaxID=74315 RepID=A0A4Y9RQ69_9CAUL|nr:hypothetical protein [Brevundimonas intermedia]TFW11043.1 hypothetical protein EGY25_15280 [Brevundimonas intermedia]